MVYCIVIAMLLLIVNRLMSSVLLIDSSSNLSDNILRDECSTTLTAIAYSAVLTCSALQYCRDLARCSALQSVKEALYNTVLLHLTALH